MGYLKQFARSPLKGSKTETITSRVPEEMYDEFKKYCKKLGLTLSEAVYLLVKKELESEKGVQKNTVNVPIEEISKQMDTNVVKHVQPKTKTVAPRSLKKQFEIDGKVPCPLCDTWQSSVNFSRHAKSHGLSTEEIFENNKEKALAMLEKEHVE
jgi:antitoxin component of RelBE/YafQ-DinJ toxin-antitoxin module